MTCDESRAHLADLARGALEGPLADSTRDHVSRCPSCERQLHQYRAVAESLSELRAPAPEGLSAAVRARIHDALKKEAVVTLSLGRVGLAVAGGLATVLLHAAVLYGRVDAASLLPEQLVAVTAVWSALAIGAFCWVLGRFELADTDLSVAGLFALATSGLGSLGILLCPQDTYFALWEGSAASHSLARSVGAWASYGAFGLLYGLPPSVAVAVSLGGRAARRGFDGALLGSAAAVALWLPATYLQCPALGLGLLLAWALGALTGIAAGSIGGLHVRRLLIPAGWRLA